MRFEAADWAVVPLDTPLAHSPSITGPKAAHLARAGTTSPRRCRPCSPLPGGIRPLRPSVERPSAGRQHGGVGAADAHLGRRRQWFRDRSHPGRAQLTPALLT